MKNKILWLILAVLLVVSAAFYFIKGKPGDTGFDLSDRQFAIEQMEDVGVISIERTNYPKMVFTKKNNQWFLNTGREARNEAVNYMLSVLKNLKIKYIPNQKASETIIKSINKSGIKIMLFDNDQEHMKTFFMGPDMGDGAATAFLMEGAKQPYVMYVPSFTGSIRTRFVFDINEYETKTLFAEKADDIQGVEVKYPLDKASSYSIERKTLGFDFLNPYYSTKLPKQNDKLIDSYLHNFQSIVAEYNDSNNAYRDSITKTTPYCEIRLQLKDQKEKKAVVFSLPNIEWGAAKFSPKDPVSDDTRYIVHTDDNQLLLMQHRILKKIMLSFDAFAVRD